jgi:hypothetical protein
MKRYIKPVARKTLTTMTRLTVNTKWISYWC